MATAMSDAPASTFATADRLAEIGVSPILTIVAETRRRQATGQSVIDLSAGEPDFDTSRSIRRAAVDAIEHGHTRYTAVGGDAALKRAIARMVLHRDGRTIAPERIICSTGAKQVIANAMFATLDPGDEVILPLPYWTSYPDIVTLASGRVVALPTSAATGFCPAPKDLDRAISDRTRWLFLNFPSNPSGAVASAAQLSAIAEVLRAHPRVWILSDEIYRDILFDGIDYPPLSRIAPDLKERLLVVDGVSKAHAMTGWRIGWGVGPRLLIAAMEVVQSQLTSCPNAIAQQAAAAAVSGPQDEVVERLNHYARRRTIALDRLSELPGVRPFRPSGGFFLWLDCRNLLAGCRAAFGDICDDVALAAALLKNGLAVVPGSAFGMADHVRLSFATADDLLIEGCRRFANTVHALALSSDLTRRSGRPIADREVVA